MKTEQCDKKHILSFVNDIEKIYSKYNLILSVRDMRIINSKEMTIRGLILLEANSTHMKMLFNAIKNEINHIIEPKEISPIDLSYDPLDYNRYFINE